MIQSAEERKKRFISSFLFSCTVVWRKKKTFWWIGFYFIFS